jgi:hypothetical protein
MGIGDWGLGIGDWGLGPIPNPQSPIPIGSFIFFYEIKKLLLFLNFNLINFGIKFIFQFFNTN